MSYSKKIITSLSLSFLLITAFHYINSSRNNPIFYIDPVIRGCHIYKNCVARGGSPFRQYEVSFLGGDDRKTVKQGLVLNFLFWAIIFYFVLSVFKQLFPRK